MRYVLEDIAAEELPDEMRRRGVPPRQRLRVLVETLDDDVPLGRIAETGGAFAFLADEPELYSEADVQRSDA